MRQSSDFGNDRPVSSCGTRRCSGTVPCISSAGGGTIRLRSKTGKDGQERALTGAVDLSKHVYNGVLIPVSKNLQKDADKMVTFLEITPVPQVIQVQFISDCGRYLYSGVSLVGDGRCLIATPPLVVGATVDGIPLSNCEQMGTKPLGIMSFCCAHQDSRGRACIDPISRRGRRECVSRD